MIRVLTQADLPQILAIEKAVHIAPWTEETFKICFESGYSGWVIEKNGTLIGFIMTSLSTEECHILNVCVRHLFQRQGYGHQLLTQALHAAKKKGATVAYLEVRRSNSRAIALYKKMHFHLVGERKEYYPTPAGNEDALIFAKALHQV